MSEKPNLTTHSVNAWFKEIVAHPKKSPLFKENWTKLLMSEFRLTHDQQDHISQIPAEYVADLQKAMNLVVDHGGAIRVERESETSPGKLIVEPSQPAGKPAPESFSVGIFHCTFDANCRHWHCGWGPAKKK